VRGHRQKPKIPRFARDDSAKAFGMTVKSYRPPSTVQSSFVVSMTQILADWRWRHHGVETLGRSRLRSRCGFSDHAWSPFAREFLAARVIVRGYDHDRLPNGALNARADSLGSCTVNPRPYPSRKNRPGGQVLP